MGFRFVSNEFEPRVTTVLPPYKYAEHDDDFTILIDAKGVIAGASAGALQLLGCAEEELIGTYYGVFFKTLHFQPEASEGSMSEDEESSLRSNEDDSSCPLNVFGFVRRADGTRHPMEATIAFGRLGQEVCGRPWNGAVLTSKL